MPAPFAHEDSTLPKASPMTHSLGRPVVWDAVQRLPRNIGRALVWVYRHTLSPLVGYNCRHLPTCSVYGEEAIARHGLWAGGWMTLARLMRCHPWGTSGLDLVPERISGRARWYAPWRYGRWRGTQSSL